MNVEDLLTAEGLEYKVSGRDFLIHCLNPDHEDTNPSMRIDNVKGIFHCLSCGFKGNIFSFFDKTPDFVDLARNSLLETIQNVRVSSLGLEYPPGVIWWDHDYRGIKASTYSSFDAFSCPEFGDRIVFPIKDASNKVRVFHGRSLGDEKPKYRNFPSGISMSFFPALASPIQGRIVLVEGIFDFLNLWDKGLENAIACFGVNTVTKEKLELLKMQGVMGIDCMFDPDDAGQNQSESVRNICSAEGLKFKNIKLRDGDPGSLSQETIIRLTNHLYG